MGVGLTVIALIAVGVGVTVVRGNGTSSTGNAATPRSASTQLADVQQSCQQWSTSAASHPGIGSPSGGSCAALGEWMGRQLASGHMDGVAMWGSAATLQSTCQQWMATGSGSTVAGTGAQSWCGEMAAWMAQHVGSWRTWMVNGTMMGG